MSEVSLSINITMFSKMGQYFKTIIVNKEMNAM